MRKGPVLIGFDGTEAAERAVRESAELLAPRPAVVVVVVEPGRVFTSALGPRFTAGIPVTTLEVRTAVQLEESVAETAKRLAERGAALARESGFDAEGLAIADDAGVADTLLKLAAERDAQALALGAHGHRTVSELLMGSTTRDVLKRATCPVLVVRGGGEATRTLG